MLIPPLAPYHRYYEIMSKKGKEIEENQVIKQVKIKIEFRDERRKHKARSSIKKGHKKMRESEKNVK